MNKNKRIMTRKRPDNLEELEKSYHRLFNGRGSPEDAAAILKDFDYIMQTMRVTPRDNVTWLQPNPVACQWQSGIVWFLNQIHNMIAKGDQININRNRANYTGEEGVRGYDDPEEE